MIKKLGMRFILWTFLGAYLPIGAQTPNQGMEKCLGGQLDAPIRVEVFSDFQCPTCRTLYLETVRPVLKDYSTDNKVCVIYHEFPLAMHPYARVAARYALAAQKLGKKQWSLVVDILYTNQAQWSPDGNVEAVLSPAMPFEEFRKLKKALDDPGINESIERDIALGKKRSVDSTPTLFINALGREERVVGFIPYAVLKDFFDRIVK